MTPSARHTARLQSATEKQREKEQRKQTGQPVFVKRNMPRNKT